MSLMFDDASTINARSTPPLEEQSTVYCKIRESSFNMTRGGGGGGDEDIETRSLKF